MTFGYRGQSRHAKKIMGILKRGLQNECRICFSNKILWKMAVKKWEEWKNGKEH